MYPLTQFKTTVPHSMSRLPLRRGLLFIPLVFICLGLLPAVRAVSPQPDGTYASFNVAEGFNALLALTTGTSNTAIGFAALASNTIGNHNTAFGLNTMLFNTSGSFNMGIGGGCLRNNFTGNNNTAIGFQAMSANKASDNVAIGYQALFKNTTGERNNALGEQAIYNNQTGFYNNAHGYNALFNSTGGENNAFGDLAMENNTTGASNTAIGDDALRNNVDGDFNVAVGDEAGTGLGVHVNNCIAIGAHGAGSFAGLDDTCFIGSIHGEPVSDAGSQQAVFVDQFNVVGIQASARRYKHDIQPMEKASETLYGLKPVTFKYNSDVKSTTQYGLVAEEVAELNPGLVSHNKEGEISSVHYEQVNMMLLNEFLKEHKKVQDLEATVALQQKGMKVLTAQLKEQAAQIQKVSAQIQLKKQAPRTVANE